MSLKTDISKYYQWFINPNNERIISKRVYLNFLLLVSSGVSVVILLLSYMLDLYLDLVFYYTVFIFSGIIPTWLINRYSSRSFYSSSFAFIGILLLFNMFYFANNFSIGPVQYFLFPFIFIIIYFSGKKNSYFLYLIILTNILILSYLEYKIPDIAIPYKDRETQFLDHYATFLLTGIIMTILLLNIIKLQIKEKKIATESNKLKTTFLANTSHDLRSPIHAIVGFSNLLENEHLTKNEQQKYVNVITTNKNQLLNLINDIFDVSIIDSGNFKLHKEFINLNYMIEEIYSITKLNIENSSKNIALEVHYGLPETQSIIFADSVRIKQVLINLIQNAIKHTEIGAISFGYHKKIKSNVLEFYVKDTGSGIPSNEVDNIFNRYVTNINKSKSIKGIGLGLHITNSLVKLMAGEIRVNSELGKGTHFFFTLPLDSQKEPEK